MIFLFCSVNSDNNLSLKVEALKGKNCEILDAIFLEVKN